MVPNLTLAPGTLSETQATSISDGELSVSERCPCNGWVESTVTRGDHPMEV